MSEPRREDAEPAEPEPAVDGEAVELPAPEPDPIAAQETVVRTQPPPRPEPEAAQETVVRTQPPPRPEPSAPSAPPPAPAPAQQVVVDPPVSGLPFADGHAADPPPTDRIKVVAAERPELVVGAAFAGGILAAMILRRLGN